MASISNVHEKENKTYAQIGLLHFTTAGTRVILLFFLITKHGVLGRSGWGWGCVKIASWGNEYLIRSPHVYYRTKSSILQPLNY